MAARPARRSAPTAPSGNPLVRDFGRQSGPIAVEWDVRTVFDFAFSLSEDAGTTDDMPGEDRRWLSRAKAELKAATGQAYELYGSSELCISLATLAVDRPDVTDAAAFVDLLREIEPAAVLRAIIGEDLRDPRKREAAELAATGDEPAILAMVKAFSDGHSGTQLERYTRLFTQPDVVLAEARSVLEAWLPAYAEIEPRVGEMLRRDYDLRGEDRRRLGPADLIERTTGGIRWLSEPGVERVILAPSYFSRPYNFLLGGEDWRFFGYPISDEALDATDPLAPPQAVVRLHRALGDETRLRILRLLRDRDAYLTEIAERLELSKPTIKHHLALLRAAGLVTLTEEGGLSYYSLRSERLDDASAELKHFLIS